MVTNSNPLSITYRFTIYLVLYKIKRVVTNSSLLRVIYPWQSLASIVTHVANRILRVLLRIVEDSRCAYLQNARLDTQDYQKKYSFKRGCAIIILIPNDNITPIKDVSSSFALWLCENHNLRRQMIFFQKVKRYSLVANLKIKSHSYMLSLNLKDLYGISP